MPRVLEVPKVDLKVKYPTTPNLVCFVMSLKVYSLFGLPFFCRFVSNCGIGYNVAYHGSW